MDQGAYVHGYGAREGERLQDQASALVDLLHGDTAYGPGERVLEAGCGVGAQTVTLATRSPDAHVVAVDVSPASVRAAQAATAHLPNVEVLAGDLWDLPFPAAGFDHAFVCFVLEHLADPVAALRAVARHVRPGGTLTVVEGDHGSTFFHPESAAARAAIACQVELQARAGGDAMIGRRVHPLLVAAGLADVEVTQRVVYADGARPALQRAFTLQTFTAMVEGVREEALAAGITTAGAFDAGVRDLRRTAEPDGTFSYSFFKGTGVVS